MRLVLIFNKSGINIKLRSGPKKGGKNQLLQWLIFHYYLKSLFNQAVILLVLRLCGDTLNYLIHGPLKDFQLFPIPVYP